MNKGPFFVAKPVFSRICLGGIGGEGVIKLPMLGEYSPE